LTHKTEEEHTRSEFISNISGIPCLEIYNTVAIVFWKERHMGNSTNL